MNNFEVLTSLSTVSKKSPMYTYVIFDGETHKKTLGDGEKACIESLYGGGGGDDGDGGGKCPSGNPNHPKCPQP